MKFGGVDKSLFAFILGPIVSLLVASGAIDPANQNAAIQGAQIWAGVVLFLGSLIIGALHHTELNKWESEPEGKPVSQPVQNAS